MTRAVALFVLTAVVAGCGASNPASTAAVATTRTPSGTVTVLAAASLTGPFEQLSDQLAEDYPGLEVVFSFGPSSGLVEQVIAGASADVLATADVGAMQPAVAGGLTAGEPVVFARNSLALVVPADNPGGVTGLADLARTELLVALCQPRVPCGAAAQVLLQRAGVTAQADTFGIDVKDVLALVELGEVDAGLVYRTDAAAASRTVQTIAVPGAEQVVNDYPVVVMADAPNPAGAQVVLEAIVGEPGQRLLHDAGFLAP